MGASGNSALSLRNLFPILFLRRSRLGAPLKAPHPRLDDGRKGNLHDHDLRKVEV